MQEIWSRKCWTKETRADNEDEGLHRDESNGRLQLAGTPISSACSLRLAETREDAGQRHELSKVIAPLFQAAKLKLSPTLADRDYSHLSPREPAS